ncbi:hypothetical protein TCDM_11499 [Trypanosoma cruzi Dm28c]|uniref:Uncharacterized protein n=1 Tax=Trypanosoma cruzi Dm28c TaxID=1416333 RepID=V5B085_TRYCR|nr:hypothetical protein TCDM_11499 [Trypanosoma cruzi Dm28c]
MLALSVHPTSSLKRPRQAPINKIMRRWRQPPCRHFRAPQQRHQQQERASLCLQLRRPPCSWPLGALNTTQPSRAHKTSLTQMPFILSANGVAALNHVQIIHNTSSKVPFHCHTKKDKNVLKSQHKYHFALLTAHCPAHDRCYSPLRSPLIPFLPARTYITVAIPPKKDFVACWHRPHLPLHPGLPHTGGQTGRLCACACGWPCKKLMEFKEIRHTGQPRPRIGGSLVDCSRKEQTSSCCFSGKPIHYHHAASTACTGERRR